MLNTVPSGRYFIGGEFSAGLAFLNENDDVLAFALIDVLQMRVMDNYPYEAGVNIRGGDTSKEIEGYAIISKETARSVIRVENMVAPDIDFFTEHGYTCGNQWGGADVCESDDPLRKNQVTLDRQSLRTELSRLYSTLGSDRGRFGPIAPELNENFCASDRR